MSTADTVPQSQLAQILDAIAALATKLDNLGQRFTRLEEREKPTRQKQDDHETRLRVLEANKNTTSGAFSVGSVLLGGLLALVVAVVGGGTVAWFTGGFQ